MAFNTLVHGTHSRSTASDEYQDEEAQIAVRLACPHWLKRRGRAIPALTPRPCSGRMVLSYIEWPARLCLWYWENPLSELGDQYDLQQRMRQEQPLPGLDTHTHTSTHARTYMFPGVPFSHLGAWRSHSNTLLEPHVITHYSIGVPFLYIEK